jgi:hypothetical protein
MSLIISPTQRLHQKPSPKAAQSRLPLEANTYITNAANAEHHVFAIIAAQ